ncbi:DUF2306 domain-containing protein [Emticicia sp. BO119]|uniref:DUF2306 domain-containing protein n=1 Tax=Emticicia sp. BO119 TaxID=2757768 RepID=UPI0015F0D5C2|nr:DUF2306 domain-containing protein [Emticicia sp. BO119]MBA4849329.1 DUF2306 domain-containing protein [Emticicia sp. BO119]
MPKAHTIDRVKSSADFKLERVITKIFYWTRILLITTVWVSAGLFGLYILAFYAAALYQGNLEKWNGVLPGLYDPNTQKATMGIGLHFAMGGIVLILGSIQLIDAIRIKYLTFHRWIGRIYITASILVAVGGLFFILAKGTIGGTVMNIGFGLYGGLMLVAAIQTYRYAVTKNPDTHRAWALRLYALAIGSWLYRMDYGFWFMLTDKAGHNNTFTGAFDYVMAFFFYIPNLLVAEIFIRSQNKSKTSLWLNLFFILVLWCVISFLLLATYYFTKLYWVPAILEWLF